MDDSGYIKIPRYFFSDRLWKAIRTLSECEAWIDLIQSAQCRSTVTIERIVAVGEVTYGRGQYPTSVRCLAKKWGWTTRKVSAFLDLMKRVGAINVEPLQNVSIITINNFDDFCPQDEEPAGYFDYGKATGNSKNVSPSAPPKALNDSSELGKAFHPLHHPRRTLVAPSSHPSRAEEVYNSINSRDSSSNECSSYPEGRIDKSFGTAKAVLQSGTAEQPHPPSAVCYERLVEFFNAETRGVFGVIKMPLSATRRGMIAARIREHGEEAFLDAVKRAAQSAFLRGQNNRGWRATFDWIIRPTNFEKIISGNYDNTGTEHYRAAKGGAGGIDEDFLRGVAEGIARGSLDGDGRDK